MNLIQRMFALAFLLVAIVECLVFHSSAAEVVAFGYCGSKGDGKELIRALDCCGNRFAALVRGYEL